MFALVPPQLVGPVFYVLIAQAVKQCTSRLIRGDGEVVEEIVSKQRQQQINKVQNYH